MGKKKTDTTSSESSHTVVTPNNPQWVTDTAQGLNGAINKIISADPQSYVAPTSELERTAGARAAALGSQTGAGSDAWFQSLMDGPAPTVTSASLLDHIGDYQNPYRDQVVSTSLADFDADAARTRAAQTLDLAGQGAFGGSGAALTRSLTESELARARATQDAKLRADMFNTGANLSNLDADRRQQASAANAQLSQQDRQWKAQLGLDRQASNRADIATQAQVGQQLRGADQATRSAPLSVLSQAIDMFSGLPTSLFHGQTTDTQGNSKSSEVSSGASLAEIAQLISSLNGWQPPRVR